MAWMNSFEYLIQISNKKQLEALLLLLALLMNHLTRRSGVVDFTNSRSKWKFKSFPIDEPFQQQVVDVAAGSSRKPLLIT